MSDELHSRLGRDSLQLARDARIRSVVDDDQAADLAEQLLNERALGNVVVAGHDRPDARRIKRCWRDGHCGLRKAVAPRIAAARSERAAKALP